MLRTKFRRLDFFFISNTIQEATKRTDFQAAFSTDHSLIFFSLSKSNILTKVKGLWKFKNSYPPVGTILKQHIALASEICDKENVSDVRVKW